MSAICFRMVRIIFTFTVFCLAWETAQARFEPIGTGISLKIQQFDTDITIDNSETDSSIDRVRIAFNEQLARWADIGIHAGYQRLTQTDNPATAGLELTGEFIGLQIHFHKMLARNTEIQLQSYYSFNDISDAAFGQKTEMKWHEVVSRFGIKVRLNDFNLSVGKYAQALDGDETASGVIQQTRDLDVENNTGTYYGIDYLIDQTGSIGIHAETKSRDGFSIVIAREF